MRRTSALVQVLSLLSLLIFCKLASAFRETPPHPSRQCAFKDFDCRGPSLAKQDDYAAAVFSEEKDWTDVAWFDLEAGLVRLDPGLSLERNEVHCWPSVGGIIVAERVHPVELAYIGLDRFHATPRSTNKTEEDTFCMQLRKIGGKWWRRYYDFSTTTKAKMRKMWPDEREVLFLGWPEQGGVWVLRYESWKMVGGGLGPVWNALSMEERCVALEKHGAMFFENPEESEFVVPLLKSFGNREPRRDLDLEDKLDVEGGEWWDHGNEL